MKNVLVSGGHGFLAGYVVEELQRRGFHPVVTVRHHEDNPILKDATIYYVDTLDETAIYGAIQHVDGVIHLAGLLGTAENIRQGKIMNKSNIDGALNILNAIDNFKIPCVMIGVGNYTELNTYSISKTTAERYALMYAKNFKSPVNVVRALNAIGPRQKWGKINKILPTFINKALRNQDIQVYGGKDHCGIMDMVYAGDVAKVLIEVLLKTDCIYNGNIFEAGTGVGYEVYDIAEQVIKACNSKSRIIEVPMRPGESERSVVVANKPWELEGGYRTFESILTDTVKYYAELLSSGQSKGV